MDDEFWGKPLGKIRRVVDDETGLTIEVEMTPRQWVVANAMERRIAQLFDVPYDLVRRRGDHENPN